MRDDHAVVGDAEEEGSRYRLDKQVSSRMSTLSKHDECLLDNNATKTVRDQDDGPPSW